MTDEGPRDKIKVGHVPLHAGWLGFDVISLARAVLNRRPFGIRINQSSEPAHRIGTRSGSDCCIHLAALLEARCLSAGAFLLRLLRSHPPKRKLLLRRGGSTGKPAIRRDSRRHAARPIQRSIGCKNALMVGLGVPHCSPRRIRGNHGVHERHEAKPTRMIARGNLASISCNVDSSAPNAGSMA